MSAPRFFNLPRTVTVLAVAIIAGTGVLAKTPPDWYVVAVLCVAVLVYALMLWSIECALYTADKTADYYEDALRDLRKDLDRG